MLYYTYMVRCADQSLYTGWTLDVPRRVAAHNDGRGGKDTRSRGPVTLAGCPGVPAFYYKTRGHALGMANQAVDEKEEGEALPGTAFANG